jgi:hypothetical protein
MRKEETMNTIKNKFALVLLVVCMAYPTLAQSSVEKVKTSQQAQERVDELQRAQNAVKKGEKQEAPKTGRMFGDYSTTSSLEFGYRTTDVNGSRDKFMSDVNIREGLRLFNYSLDSRSVTGTGLYDFMHADATGAGGDPQQTFAFRIDKARAYKFDASVRRLNYLRFLPEYALGTHNIDTRQQISDFNLKLLPQRAVRFNLGYNRAMQKGYSQITTSANSDIFPDPGNRRWESNNYRIGLDATWRNWDFFAEEMYRTYKWDTAYNWPGGVNPGVINPSDAATITYFTRPEASRAHGSVTRASVNGSLAKRIHIVLRGMYSEERLNSFIMETYAGTTTAANTKILTNVFSSNGSSRRPSTSFDAGVSFDLTDHLRLDNSFRYSDFTINGFAFVNTLNQRQVGTGPITTTNPAPFAAFPNQSTAFGTYATRNTELANYVNTLDLIYSRGRKLTASAGWRATHRDVTLSDLGGAENDQQNTNAGIGNLRIRPVERFNLFFDYEKGQSNNVFVRVAPMDFQRARARASVEATHKLTFIATVATTDRNNPTQFVQNDSNYRSASFSALWEPMEKLFFNAGYNYDYIHSEANIYYFIASTARTGKSLFYSKQDFFFFDTRVPVTKYADVLMVYRYVHDRGAPTVVPLTGANDFVTAFPLRRHNPEARLALHFNRHATFNFSYRHFSYNERNFFRQDYRSNILTSSLRLTF